MKNYLLIAAIALCGVSSEAKTRVCEGIFPKNNLWIPAGARTASGIDQDTFNAVIDKVENTYQPIVQAHGGNLEFNRLWDDGTVNSDTDVEGNNWIVNSYGGLARYQGMNYDGFAAIACHEIGHHLGGAPLFSGQDWASVEGEADYFATLKCFRVVFAGDDNEKIVAGMTVDATARQKCETNFPNNSKEIALCERASMAGFVIAKIAGSLSQDKTPGFNTPDPSQVSQVFEDHPQAQCRLDTYFAASICTVPTNTDLGNPDYRTVCMYRHPSRRPPTLLVLSVLICESEKEQDFLL